MQNLIITEKGKEMIAGLVAGSLTATFTKIETTDYDYSGLDETELEKLTTIYSPKQTAEVAKITRTDVNIVEVSAAIDNKTLTEGYYVRAVGLFARTTGNVELLYGISVENQNPDYMPAFGGRNSTGITYRFDTKVDNSENITVEVNPAATPTIQQVEDVQKAADKASKAIETHTSETVVSDSGVHDLRVFNGKLQYKNGANWVDVTPENASNPFPFTVSAESWSLLDTPKGGCNYSASITVDGVTADDIADVIFGVDSFDVLSAAGVSTGGETGDNKVTLYAVSAPEISVSGVAIVYKGGK